MRFIAPTQLYEGYVFDCDGTLAESMPLHYRAWCHAFESEGAPFEFTWPIFVQRAGMPLERTVEALNRQFAANLDVARVVAVQRSTYQALLPEVTPIAPVVEFARNVARRSPLAVASGAHRAEVERSLELLGIRELFQVVLTATEVPHGKPFPDIFIQAARRLGVTPAHCLVVEDSELGFEAARRAGMDWIRVAPCPIPKATSERSDATAEKDGKDEAAESEARQAPDERAPEACRAG